MRHILFIAALAVGLAPGLVQAQADDYPSKPVMVVVPYEGGGVVEQEFRLFMNSIRETTGKSFVMENRAGAGTTIGTAFAAKAAPDGYTLLTVNSPFTVAPTIYPDLPYDSIKDFSPISLLTKHAFLVMVHPSAPRKSRAGPSAGPGYTASRGSRCRRACIRPAGFPRPRRPPGP